MKATSEDSTPRELLAVQEYLPLFSGEARKTREGALGTPASSAPSKNQVYSGTGMPEASQVSSTLDPSPKEPDEGWVLMAGGDCVEPEGECRRETLR